MEVHITESEGTMTARLVGRLDTPAAAEVIREIQPMLDNAGKNLLLDCSEMTYISSSGLRIFSVSSSRSARRRPPPADMSSSKASRTRSGRSS